MNLNDCETLRTQCPMNIAKREEGKRYVVRLYTYGTERNIAKAMTWADAVRVFSNRTGGGLYNVYRSEREFYTVEVEG